MNKKRRPILWLLVCVLLMGLWTPGGAFADTPDAEDILASMTTEEKISQMLVPAVRYYQKDGGEKEKITVLPKEIADYLAAHSFGGVILFAENTQETEQTTRLIDAIQVANAAGDAKSQLFVCVDQEGGDVTRLNECVQGPGNMALSATGRDEDVTTIYSIIGTELDAVGFNVDFCPDSDVNNNPANPIIGIRSFSDDPKIVTEKAKLAYEAIYKKGVIASPKHFPGHGNTATDSHTGLPCIDASYDEIKSLELVPFRAAIDQGAEMIMTAHIQYPKIEKETYTSMKTGEKISLPATLSKTIITDILRKDMGFDGVVVTDAMNMDAIAAHFNPMDAAVLAINAGVDILLMWGDISTTERMEQLAEGIKKLAEKADADEAFGTKVDAAVLRILKLKEKYGLLSGYDGSQIESKVANAMKTVSTRANHDIEWDITTRAVTMVKNDNQTLPLRDEGEKTVILTAYDDEPLPMDYVVSLLRLENKLPKNATYEIHSFRGKEAPDKRQEVLDWIKDADNVIAVSEMGSARFLKSDTAGLMDELIAKTHEQGGKFIIMSVLLPYDVARFQAADAIMISYGARSMNVDPRTDKEPMKRYGPNIAAAIYLMLQDEIGPTGKLPVNLPKLTTEGYSSEILYARGYGLTYEKDTPQPVKNYSNEWVDGKWYNKDGTQTYGSTGKWQKDSKGWWYGDTSGWYAKNRWQKIDGKWYYFNKSGYAVQNAFIDGWWLNRNTCQCTWKYQSGWRKDSKGWWYGDASGWYAKNGVYTIDNVKYVFDAKGYCVNP